MWRWTKRILIALCGLLIVAVLSGATYQWNATRNELAATPPPGRLVDVGGHRLHIWCTGAGTPSVILETGLGGSSADWGFVQPEVSRFTQVCSYDRAGMGYSDPGPSPRTTRRIARELARISTARRHIRPEPGLVGAVCPSIRARDELSRHRISGGSGRDHAHTRQCGRGQGHSPEADHSSGGRDGRPGNRPGVARLAA